MYSLKKLWPFWAANRICRGISNQDTIHEGTTFVNVLCPSLNKITKFFCIAAKMRARILRAEKFLAIGNKIASVAHLKSLLQIFGKDVHLLKPEDLNAKDKMNYASCERLCQPHVRKLLKENVPSRFIVPCHTFYKQSLQSITLPICAHRF